MKVSKTAFNVYSHLRRIGFSHEEARIGAYSKDKEEMRRRYRELVTKGIENEKLRYMIAVFEFPFFLWGKIKALFVKQAIIRRKEL